MALDIKSIDIEGEKFVSLPDIIGALEKHLVVWQDLNGKSEQTDPLLRAADIGIKKGHVSQLEHQIGNLKELL